MKLSDVNFEKQVNEMLIDFIGYKDTDAVLNIKVHGRITQVQMVLVDQDESDFNDYDGVPVIEL